MLLPSCNRHPSGQAFFSRGPPSQTTSSRGLFVGNVGLGRGDTAEDLMALVGECEAVLVGDGVYSFVLFPTPEAASQFLNTAPTTLRGRNVSFSRCLYLPDTDKFQRALEYPVSTHLPPEALEFELEPSPPGLHYLPEFISDEEHDALMSFIDSQPWIEGHLKRRVQHYGCQFNYVDLLPHEDIDVIPPILQVLADKVRSTGLVSVELNQVTVNEYLPGGGIGFHIDTHSPFKEAVVIVSLLSDIPMNWKRRPRDAYYDIKSNKNNFDKKFDILLQKQSLTVFKETAKWGWEHGIISRKVDVLNGRVVPRQRRISITFRKVMADNQCECDWPDRCDAKNPTYLADKRPERVACREM